MKSKNLSCCCAFFPRSYPYGRCIAHTLHAKTLICHPPPRESSVTPGGPSPEGTHLASPPVPHYCTHTPHLHHPLDALPLCMPLGTRPALKQCIGLPTPLGSHIQAVCGIFDGGAARWPRGSGQVAGISGNASRCG